MYKYLLALPLLIATNAFAGDNVTLNFINLSNSTKYTQYQVRINNEDGTSLPSVTCTNRCSIFLDEGRYNFHVETVGKPILRGTLFLDGVDGSDKIVELNNFGY